MSLNNNTVIANNVTSDISGLLKYGQVIHKRSYMTPLSDGTPTNIRMYFISLENRSINLHFTADNIGLSSLKFFWSAPEFLSAIQGNQGHPRSMNLVAIESTYICDFLLVRNSNLGTILHRFGDLTVFMCS